MIHQTRIRSLDDLRAELLKLPSRTGHSLTALSNVAEMSLTVVDFARRPNVRKSITVEPVLTLLTVARHEVLIRPVGDQDGGTPIQTNDDLRAALAQIPERTGRSFSAICRGAGLSQTVPSFVTQPNRGGVRVHALLAFLKAAGHELVIRRNGGGRRRLAPAAARHEEQTP